jgi:cytoskeleton protein RodZ
MDASPQNSGLVLDLMELGRRLTEARLAVPLTLDEIAQQLHLPLATVTDLESGRSERIGSPVYLKGFLRSYLRLMGLPEAWAEQALATSTAVAAPMILPAAGAVARRVSWIERYKWAASYIVGTALALTAVHWLVSNTPQLGFPETTRTTSVALDAPTTENDAGAPQASSRALSVDLSVPGPVTASSVDDTDELPVMASLNPFRVPGDVREAQPVAPIPLTLSFEQDSWVEVRNESGGKLAYQVVRAGEKRTFSDGAPFSVLIGNVRGVHAEVAGNAVDLDIFTRGNVARFAVAESDGVWSPVAAE